MDYQNDFKKNLIDKLIDEGDRIAEMLLDEEFNDDLDESDLTTIARLQGELDLIEHLLEEIYHGKI